MNVRQLEMCMNLAETLNFGKTAAAFFTTQPVVSYQIQNLEEELNLKLFERANRHVALTAAGEVFCNEMKPALALMDRAVYRARSVGCPKQVLRVGGLTRECAGMLAEISQRFAQEFPQCELLFSLYDVHTDEKFLQGQYNICLRLEPAVRGIPEIEMRPLMKSCFHCLMLKKNPLAKRERLLPHDLEGQTLILASDWTRMPPLREAIETMLLNNKEMQIKTYDDEASAVLYVQAYNGIALLGYSMVPESTMVCRRADDLVPGFDICVVWHKGDTSRETMEFVRIVSEEFAKLDQIN